MIVGAGRARAVDVGLGALAGDALAPADHQCAARRHARADDADVDLDGSPQPGHVAEPGDVPGVDKDDGDIVQTDRGGDDDQQTGREEGENVHPLREADLQQDQAAQGDDEDDDVEDEVNRGGGELAWRFVDALALARVSGYQDVLVVAKGSGHVRGYAGGEGGRRTGIVGRRRR